MDPMVTNLLLAGLVLLAGLRLYLRYAGTISGKRARQLVAQGARLVDVRTPAEFRVGHIDGAQNLPLHELASRVNELGPDKQQAIVLYCKSGARSARAKSMLSGKGFGEVHNLGPMSRWR